MAPSTSRAMMCSVVRLRAARLSIRDRREFSQKKNRDRSKRSRLGFGGHKGPGSRRDGHSRYFESPSLLHLTSLGLNDRSNTLEVVHFLPVLCFALFTCTYNSIHSQAPKTSSWSVARRECWRGRCFDRNPIDVDGLAFRPF